VTGSETFLNHKSIDISVENGKLKSFPNRFKLSRKQVDTQGVLWHDQVSGWQVEAYLPVIIDL
jgi:hypothetical protein